MAKKSWNKEKNDLGMKEENPVDIACETCTKEGCKNRAQGKRCTRWAHREEISQGNEWKVIVDVNSTK